MCTVSVISLPGGGFRLVTNRDESPNRPRATPPGWRGTVAGAARGIWPIDGLAGGTWVAAAEHGLALTLLNGNPGAPPPKPHPDRHQSRGILIPRLIGAADALEAADALAEFDLTRFEPFRLVAVDAIDEPRVVESYWDGADLTTVDLTPPACFASSGLGDRLVQCRLPLFEELVVDPGPTPDNQDAFHQHRWPDHPELSVLMERDAARTVSITRVEIKPGDAGLFEVSMEHVPVEVGAPR